LPMPSCFNSATISLVFLILQKVRKRIRDSKIAILL
jgi:hypothetical protein